VKPPCGEEDLVEVREPDGVAPYLPDAIGPQGVEGFELLHRRRPRWRLGGRGLRGRYRSGAGGRLLAHDRVGVAVELEALVGRLADERLACPLGELDADDEPRLHPMDGRESWRFGEGRIIALQPPQAREQVVSGPGVQAAAHLARETQLAVAIMHAEQEGAEVALRDAARLPAAHHELLLPPCLHLEPGVRAAARLVPAGAPLGHDALEALCLGGLEERLAITLDVARVAHQRVVPQALAQEPLALLERDVEQRAAVEVQEVEGLVHDRHVRVLPPPEAGPCLEQRERRAAGLVERDHLAVQDRLARLDPVGRAGQVREVARGVPAVACPEPDPPVTHHGLDAIAVPLDLEEPVRIAEGALGQRRGHGRHEVGHRRRRAYGLVRHRSSSQTAPASAPTSRPRWSRFRAATW